MAGFSEWSNQKKKEQGASGAQPVGTGAAQSASSGAKSFTEWSNQKHGITTPQSYRSTNTGFERSGLTRDEYDSSVRQNYCHPYSSYERGSNENLNKMFRRLFPKGTDFDIVPDEDIIAAADWMNNYPRKVLGRTTAARRFNELLSA